MLPTIEEIRDTIGIENEPLFTEYVKFILDHRKDKKEEFKMEKHHIFPRSIFPKYKKEKDNIANLTFKDHIIAHYLLYRALPFNRKIVLSLNMMINRGVYNPFYDYTVLNNPSYLEEQVEKYEEFRKTVSHEISKMNTGKKRTKEECMAISQRTKNRVVTKDKDGKIVYTTVDDERYKSGELVYYRVGYKHTDKTKQKMSDNGIKGRILVTNGTDILYVKDLSECPEGFYKGVPVGFKEKKKEYFTGKTYIFNIETGERKRWNKDDPLPEGFQYGRVKTGKFKGFDEINKLRMRIYDIRDKETKSILKTEFEPEWQLASPSPLIEYENNVKVVKDMGLSKILLLDNFYFYKIEDIESYLLEKYKINIPSKIRTSMRMFTDSYNTIVIESMHINKYKKYNFNEIFENHIGERYADIFPLNFIYLKDAVADGIIKVYNSEKTIRKYKDGN